MVPDLNFLLERAWVPLRISGYCKMYRFNSHEICFKYCLVPSLRRDRADFAWVLLFFSNRSWKFNFTWKKQYFWHGYRYVLGDTAKSTASILMKFVPRIAEYRPCGVTEAILHKWFSFLAIGAQSSNIPEKAVFWHGYRYVLGDTENSTASKLMKFVPTTAEYRHCGVTEAILRKWFCFSAIGAQRSNLPKENICLGR